MSCCAGAWDALWWRCNYPCGEKPRGMWLPWQRLGMAARNGMGWLWFVVLPLGFQRNASGCIVIPLKEER